MKLVSNFKHFFNYYIKEVTYDKGKKLGGSIMHCFI